MKTLQITARVPEGVVARIDGLAESAGLSRADLLRMVLSRLDAADLPVGLVENADRLRQARGVAQ
jgi:hypothetical protein